MAKDKIPQKEEKLNGTLAAVMILGFILIGSWFFVFDLFIDRF